MLVSIVDYQSGNLHSAVKAFERVSRETGADAEIVVTSDPDVIRRADRVVLPGVGAFADCYRGLSAAGGVLDALKDVVLAKARPFLGICVGMQLLASRGLENGSHAGLGWIDGTVEPVTPDNVDLKIPHMGWNTLQTRTVHPLFEGIPTGDDGWHAYFVHSYHFKAEDDRDAVVATSNYGGEITACVARGNIVGTQFHPEKSQKLGLKLIANFLKWRP